SYAEQTGMHRVPEYPIVRAWGTVLPAAGYQTSHIHPLGCLSGVYYAQLPDDMSGTERHDGWIEFGAPPPRYSVAEPPVGRRIEPQEGRLLIFPSYFHHRTLPFTSSESRISIAFDVVPCAIPVPQLKYSID
ncbi:MAG: 2OG-Fe(II) oxygenase family protein, partial [Gammaproteobacteria bacterium]